MDLSKYFLKIQFSTTTRMKLYMKISSFIRQGVPLFDMLNILEKKYEANKKGDIRAGVIRYWLKDMNNGKEFSDAISEWVPPAEMMLIRSGEKSGAMEEAINNAIEVTTASKRMKGAIIKGLSYPVLMIFLLCMMIYMFSVQVVPKLIAIKDPSTWPGPAQTMYKMSVFVESYWLFCVLMIVGIVIAVNYTIPRYTKKGRNFLDNIPPWSIYRSFQSSVFLISVAALMKTGTALVDAMEDLKQYSSTYVRHHIAIMIRKMNAGRSNGESLNSGFLPTEIGIDIEIYDETSDFQSAMEEVGRQSIETGIENITSAAKNIGSLVLMLVGGYIGWVYYAFFTLTSSIAQ